ncbi:MAG: HAMP domain-containing histidine kinase [Spirochaetaceae bacterium]|nr:HAMP domain-containing histidine kinase [Spirochaetaceae bacterium]
MFYFENQDQTAESEKLISLSSLVTGIAHELNTPLGISITALSYLRDFIQKMQDNPDAEDLKECIEKLDKSSQITMSSLKKAVEIIEDFKSIDVNQMCDTRNIFNLHQLLDNIIVSMSSYLTRHNIKIILKCPDNLELKSIPALYTQIFTNLIRNTIIHGFSKPSHGHIIIECSSKENLLQIFFFDDGKGISELNLSRIFDPFFTTMRGNGGKGLGLHLVYNIITYKLKGHIDCISKEDEFSCFIMTIPANIPE